MSKKYWAVGSFIGLLMIAGFGCTTRTINNNQPAEKNGSETEQTSGELINQKGNFNIALTASEKQEIVADAKKIALSAFGNRAKLQTIMDTDFVAKGSMEILYSTPEPTQTSQLDAIVEAFRATNYNILNIQRPAAAAEDKNGEIIAQKRSKILVLTFEPGQQGISFSAMTEDQYIYLLNAN